MNPSRPYPKTVPLTLPFNAAVHRSGMRLTVMVVVGLFIAVLVGTLGSWTYAPALGRAGLCFVNFK